MIYSIFTPVFNHKIFLKIAQICWFDTPEKISIIINDKNSCAALKIGGNQK